MARKTFLLAGICLGVLSTASFPMQPSVPSQMEAPMVIPQTADGHWVLLEGPERTPAFARETALGYQAPVIPRLSLHLISFKCSFPGSMEIRVLGLVPAQRFPQPAATLQVGSDSWSATPNALYSAGMPPFSDSTIKFESGRTLSFPGQPPLATLSLFRQRPSPLVEALASGAEVRVAFEGQQRSFPAVPTEMAARFASACRANASGFASSR